MRVGLRRWLNLTPRYDVLPFQGVCFTWPQRSRATWAGAKNSGTRFRKMILWEFFNAGIFVSPLQGEMVGVCSRRIATIRYDVLLFQGVV